jgi:hypothetical protein
VPRRSYCKLRWCNAAGPRPDGFACTEPERYRACEILTGLKERLGTRLSFQRVEIVSIHAFGRCSFLSTPHHSLEFFHHCALTEPLSKHSDPSLLSPHSNHNLCTMAPNQWNADDDKNLLLLLLGTEVQFSATRFNEAAARMINGVTGNACR